MYPVEIQSKLSRRSERPDRVYGLRATRKIDRLLSSADKRRSASGKSLGETIRSHPFNEDAEPIHFPFLLLEAKSEKSSDSFSDAENQTAFSIRELLKLQDDLRLASGDSAEWEAGPLVWFLSFKGEEWRVCIGYLATRGDTRCYVSPSYDTLSVV